MSEIKITPAELMEQAAQMTALKEKYESLFTEVKSDLNSMNGNWSTHLAGNFAGKISSAQKSFSAVTSMLEAGAKAAQTSAKTFESVDSLLAKGIIAEEKAKEDIIKTTKNTVTNNTKQVAEITNQINEWIDKNLSDKLPKSAIEAIKGYLKKIDVIDDAMDMWEMLSLAAQGQYGEVLGEAIGNMGSVYEKEELNWLGVKTKAVGSTLSLLFKEDGYISNNKEKYEQLAIEYLSNGDVSAMMGAITGEFVQTVGKGSVDVLCQTASSIIDSAMGKMPPLFMSLSTINQGLYDVCGWSPGHIFNSATKTISSAVDMITDDVLIGGATAITDSLQTASSVVNDIATAGVQAAGSAISSVVSGVGKWFK